MIGAYQETLQHGGDEMLLASRGEGKTCYLRAMVWKSVSEGKLDFVAFISATGEDAKNSAVAIQDMTMRSETYLALYPEIAVPCIAVGSTPQLAKHMRATGFRFDDGKTKFEQHPISFSWTSEEINMPDVPGSPSARAMMRFRGADSPIRGLNILGRRPKVVAIDDLDTPDTTNNPAVANKVVDRVNLDIGGLGSPTNRISRIMLATLPKSGCGVAHAFAEAGHPFVVRRFRYLVEKPHRWDMWMDYVRRRQRGKKADGDKYGRAAHKFYLANREEMDAGAEVSNPWRFSEQILPDGTQLQVSALQNYFDEWADKGEFFCRCELDNETIVSEDRIESRLETGHVLSCEGDFQRQLVAPTTQMIVRGIDVRKTELHFSLMASDDDRRHRIVDYDVRSHGTSETTVEQAESLILEGLHRLADEWDRGSIDWDGGEHRCDLTLIDKGWMGNWSEDGERKTWATQPVETFCMQRGLRRWLPAKGAPNYRSPTPSDDVIIGDNWHMNRGAGAERACTEVIWNAEHWHALVADLFMLPPDDDHRFELFVSEDGVWTNHKRFTGHIVEGAEELAERRQRATRTRKPKFRRDHWWDSCAMMLVARSIEEWFRENLISRSRKPPATRRLQPSETHEIGAR